MRQTSCFIRSVIGFSLLGFTAAGVGAELYAQEVLDHEPQLRTDWRRISQFRLFGDRDEAWAGFRTATFGGCTANAGDLAPSISPDFCAFFNNIEPLEMPSWFGLGFMWAVGPSEWNKHQATIPSLANALGKGYTVNTNAEYSQFTGELLPHDGTLGPFHAGASATTDGSCLDFSGDFIGAGQPLLAVNDCEVTWGSQGWQGTRPVDADGFLAYCDQVGDMNCSFEAWAVPEDLRRNDKFLGNVQTFGFFSDYSADALFGSSTQPSYGNVIPEAVGGDPATPPARTGWPLGLLAKMDAFSFSSPGLTNTGWYQITVTNNSRDLYGVGLDYDSLYIGYLTGPFHHGQGTSFYRDPGNGVIRMATFCQTVGCGPDGGDPQHPGTQWGSIVPSGVGEGFNYGASAMIVLKSPIGDLRNKFFTDPASPFFGKGNPEEWDDTITFNHAHHCGFHGCTGTIFFDVVSADYEQKQYGMVSSIASDVLGDRALGDPSDHVAWDTWRWEEFPDRSQLDFNAWVPGGWDYDDDGVPDTLHYDDCSDNSGSQFDPVTGNAKNCSVAWSDTMSSGFGNLYGNFVSIHDMGPIQLTADSTVEFVLALVHAIDSVGVENEIAVAIDHYMAFYLGPEPPPAPTITSVDVTVGGATAGPDGQPAAEVTLFWDATSEDYVDPFLGKFLADLLAADVGTDLGKIRELNSILVDTLVALIPNNVAAIHVFKSCDGGSTFTNDDDCASDPATSGGTFGGIGWLPLASIQPDASGDFPNVFTDNGVFGGRSFLYSLVAQSKGLEIALSTGDVLDTLGTGEVVCISDCGSDIFTIPSLIQTIATATGAANVASVYIPVSVQAGAAAATIELTVESPDNLPFGRMNVGPTRAEVLEGEYRLQFGDAATVTEISTLEATGAVLDTTIVDLVDSGDGTLTLIALGTPVAVEGDFTQTIDTIGSRVRQERVTTFSELSALLSDEDDLPIMVTASLAGGQTVPGRYFGLPNFPGFTMSIDNGPGGSFNEQFYLTPAGERVGPFVEPAVTFLVDDASGVAAEGRYRLTWTAQPFGTASLFRINFPNPDATRDEVVSSLEGRTAGSTGATDAATATAVGLAPEDLVAARLPFVVENITDSDSPQPVTVVVPRSGKQTNLLLGIGLDTVNVTIPETEWIPADELILVESDAVTFGTAVFGCLAALWQRKACNPVATGTRGSTGYIAAESDQQLRYSYFQTITNVTEYAFEPLSAETGDDLMDDPARIEAALDSVKVVPNPFVMFSAYSRSGGEQLILFTHVPPQGVLRIFSVAGQFIQELKWEPDDLNGQGDLTFNLRTREGNEMGAGLYLYVLEALDSNGDQMGMTKGKFVLIK